jgi:hypothetical protein
MNNASEVAGDFLESRKKIFANYGRAAIIWGNVVATVNVIFIIS